jgi:2-polyprenyl-6-methoxyphenol hydroxylase-like FAD-dependent oxidoreductase
MSRPFDICVRGAGIVGRAMALQLAAKRLRVALLDTQPEATPGHSDVRAYALSPASRSLLESLRCWPDAAFATPVKTMEVTGDNGGLLHFEAAGQGVAALNWMVDVPALETRLAQAVEFQGLIERVDAPRPAPLTVVCEGRASESRAGWGLAYDQKPYGQHALATRVRTERPHGEIARQWFNREGEATEVLALLPLDGPLGAACAVVWSVSPQRAQALREMEPTELGAALNAASHGALGAIEITAERQTWPLQFALAQNWSGAMPAADGPPGSAWVLAGDAAHTVHPLAGQGLNLGLGDVQVLARVLDERAYWRPLSDAKVLRAYERERKTAFALVGNTTDALQRLFDHPNALVAQARNWGLRGFDRSAGLKHWITRQAMGLS